MRAQRTLLVAAVALYGACLPPARAETVSVKYRGPVDLKTFACDDRP